MTDEQYMDLAIKEAEKAYEENEAPIGCVIVKNDEVIASAHNLREKTQLSTAHAEIIAIEQACKKLGSWRLEGCELYVTIEPCPMCAGAIQQSRIRRVIYGAKNPKGGFIESNLSINDVKGLNHYFETTKGIEEKKCSEIMSKYFKEKREKN